MRKILKNIFSFFAKPFTNEFAYLVTISLLVCCPRIYYYIFMSYEGVKMLIWETLHSYLLCYIVSLFIPILSGGYKKYLKMFFYLLAFIDYCIEISCLITTKTPFFPDHVCIIMSTNTSEASEFVATYFSYSLVVMVIVTTLFLILLHKIRAVLDLLGKKIYWLACIITILCFLFFIIKDSKSWSCKFYCKISAAIMYENPPSLTNFQDDIEIHYTKHKLPDKVVIILGESFAKSHSSLYGYEKKTNPLLSEMVDDSLCVVYDNVLSSETTTIPCVKSIMSTYKPSYGDSVNWYECETLPAIMSACGYEVVWVSNQSPSGVYDNVASRYADLCDTVLWTGSKHVGTYLKKYDEEILYILNEHNDIFKSKNKQCVIIHLMGSHCDYKDRYPETWNKFTIDQYNDMTEKQTRIFSSYDNSVLYNDYVVSEILSYYNSQETLAFYFSDHGLDLFESSNNYFGYGIIGNAKSLEIAKSIPFIVYMSPMYQVNFPEEKKLLEHNAELLFNTENFIDFLCSSLGVHYSR